MTKSNKEKGEKDELIASLIKGGGSPAVHACVSVSELAPTCVNMRGVLAAGERREREKEEEREEGGWMKRMRCERSAVVGIPGKVRGDARG